MTFARTKDVLGAHKRLILFYAYTVLPERPYDLVTLEGFKVVLIEDFNASVLKVYCLHTYVLINLLHLKILRLGREVGTHHTIHTEHTIVGLIVHAKVTTIAPELLSCLGVSAFHSLVYPVPNSTTHKEVGAFDSIPVVNQVTNGITH